LIERIGAPAGDVTRSGFRQGVMVNLLNPAIATFYLAIVPTFLPAGAGGDAFAVLAAIHVSMAFACHLVWTAAFDRLRHIITKPAPMRVLELLAGGTLLALAVRTVARG
jgi:threonine/homoserine/homoserine lactone efflux protein